MLSFISRGPVARPGELMGGGNERQDCLLWRSFTGLPLFLPTSEAEHTDDSPNEVPWGCGSPPLTSLSRESIVTTPRANHEQTSRAAAERNAPHAQFQRVYQENLEPIYHYVLSWVGNREDAEDLTSRIFLKAVEGVDYERPPKMIRRWLFQVARTTLADHWRERYRLITYSLEELLASDEVEPTEEEPGTSNTTPAHRLKQLLRARISIYPSPEEYLDGDEVERAEEEPAAEDNSARARVQRLLQALPARYRDVLTCRFLLNLSLRETAHRMGLSVPNVKVMQSRALKRAASLESVVPDS